MAGSDRYRRTDLKQDAWPAETAASNTLVQLAIVYRGTEVTTFRDAGVLAGNRGLVVAFPNGQEFQITIVESSRR